MKLSATAQGQITALHRHYRRLNRVEALRNLTNAIRAAAVKITAGEGIPAPTPYPQLAAPGEAWVHSGRYWITYSLTEPPVIIAVFYDEADIPGRI